MGGGGEMRKGSVRWKLEVLFGLPNFRKWNVHLGAERFSFIGIMT